VTPPVTAWMAPKLVPELICSDLGRSLAFYCEVLGFTVLFDRPAEHFSYLDRDGAHLMLEQSASPWLLAGPLEYPFGRGMNLQIEVADVDSLYEAVTSAGARIHLPMEERWYRAGNRALGNRQFVVLDPDGYVLRFFRDLGERAATP